MFSLLAHPGTKTLIVATVAAMASLPALHRLAGDEALRSQCAAAQGSGIQARNDHPFARILGEFRAGAADLMFIKTERYLHAGVAFVPHEDEEVREGWESPESAHDHDHEHDHEDEEFTPTLIRTADRDFRGWLGDIEREVKPFLDPRENHLIVSGEELLPWYRMITLSHPRFVRGYLMGAMWLNREGHTEKAMAFLDEGIEKNVGNPEVFRLYLMRALVALRQADAWGAKAHEKALADVESGYRLALEVRPANGKTGTIHGGLLWNAEHEEDFTSLARFRTLLLEQLGQGEAALEAARQAARLLPEDGVIARTLRRLESGASEDL